MLLYFHNVPSQEYFSGLKSSPVQCRPVQPNEAQCSAADACSALQCSYVCRQNSIVPASGVMYIVQCPPQCIAGTMLIRDNLCWQLKPWIENSLKRDDADNIDGNEEHSTDK